MKLLSYYFNALMENVTVFGSVFTHSILLAAAFALGDALFLVLLKGLALLYLLSMPLKFLFFKHRPRKMAYTNWWQKFEASSFPSVHAARVLFLALALHARFSNMLLSVLLLALAALVVYSRIHLKKHYWTDMAGGIVLGMVVYTLSAL